MLDVDIALLRGVLRLELPMLREVIARDVGLEVSFTVARGEVMVVAFSLGPSLKAVVVVWTIVRFRQWFRVPVPVAVPGVAVCTLELHVMDSRCVVSVVASRATRGLTARLRLLLERDEFQLEDPRRLLRLVVETSTILLTLKNQF